MTATKIQPGDDTHLTSLMALHSLNFVTGADRAALLAYGRDVFAAGQAVATPAAVAPRGERQWICPTRTVADLVNNLLTLDQALPAYGAQYIEKDGRRCAIAVPPTVSRERVLDGRWIGQGEELNAAVVWTRAEQPAAAQPMLQDEYPHEQMDAMALDRYKVVPSNASMLWSHAVVAGDGTQQLYVGREVECQNMARKFAGAFLDGAFAFHSTAAAPTATAAPALEAPAAPEPVGEAGTMPGTSGFTMACFHADKVPLGTKLYTQPMAAAPQSLASAPDWWRKRADEIEAQVAASGSSDAMRCYTDMRTLLQSAAAPQAPAEAQEPAANLHDDGYWTPTKTEAGRALNERLMRAGSPRIPVYTHPAPRQAAPQAPAAPDEAQRLAQFLQDRQTCLGSSRASAGKYNQESWDDYERAWTMLLGMAAPAAPVAIATQVIENLLQLARIVNTAVEDWGETKEDDTLHVIFHKEEADKMESILEFFDSLPDAPEVEGVILSGPSRAARVLRAQAAPAAPAVDASDDTALLDAMQRHRIALVPEFEGPWDAEIFNDEAEAHPIASGNTPREALRAAIAAQAKEGGEAA